MIRTYRLEPFHVVIRNIVLSVIYPSVFMVATVSSFGQDVTVIQDVHVVPMTDSLILQNRDVVVTDGVITAIKVSQDSKIPNGARVIKGFGMYLMPGIADMHTHIFSVDELPLYLINGVTTVRNMWGWETHLKMRDEIAKGLIAGPTVITAGAIIDGDPPHLAFMSVASTPDAGITMVNEQVDAGYDFIKVYDNLDAKTYEAICSTAQNRGVSVVGHVPNNVGIFQTLQAGQNSIEHLMGFMDAIATEEAGRLDWSPPIDRKRLSELAELIANSETWNTPTLIVHEQMDMSAAESEKFSASYEVGILPKSLRKFCCSETYEAKNDLSADERSFRKNNRLEVVRALHRAGAKLMLGTDTGNKFVIPGYSVHDELDLMIEAGLSEYEALMTATGNASKFMGESSEWGFVTVGSRADLLLVKSNPLSDLSTLRKPKGVMVRGHWLSSSDLDSLRSSLLQPEDAKKE